MLIYKNKMQFQIIIFFSFEIFIFTCDMFNVFNEFWLEFLKLGINFPFNIDSDFKL